mgnify:FL=1
MLVFALHYRCQEFRQIRMTHKTRKIRNKLTIVRVLALSLVIVLSGCSDRPWNSPYSDTSVEQQVVYSSFSERPKHLDPARSYSSNEYAFIAQIYEPLLQYHFLKRPYELTTLTAARMPALTYYDDQGNKVEEASENIAYSEYLLTIKPGINYQPHPAFARFSSNVFEYHNLQEEQLADKYQLGDFLHHASRELTVEDYIYQIKRLADLDLHSPIAGVMSEYIVGFEDFRNQLKAHKEENPANFHDLRQFDMSGVKKINDYQFTIRINKTYPQFKYWLAMPFFAPMPWEADVFYSQPILKDKNISLDWYPIGTGAFMLTENNPNLRMVMERNPNFHGETYPDDGDPEDQKNGLLDDAGKRLPFIDKAIYSLEKETIPYWNKFLQGYYDTSGVSSDSFDQAVQFNAQGEIDLTEAMQEKGIGLQTAITTSISYMGFNMKDGVIGGESERARLLRQAISIAMDYEEYISIFANGRGIAAQGPLPPGIFGYREGDINTYVYEEKNGQVRRRSVDYAKSLMKQAGYIDGIDPKTKKPLTLYLDVTATGPDDKARLNWIRKQFAKLGVQLVLRTTDYNRFQDKMRKGTAQIFMWGWNADYPDPENFLFLLYGENAKVDEGGENAANYTNPQFDQLFVKMKNLPNTAERQAIIDEMIEIARRDAPWIWGFHPKAFSLYHQWYKNVKPNLMANNTLKYKRVDGRLRAEKQQAWNQPVTWPLILIVLIVIASIIPAVRIYRQHEQRQAR